ncbi:MAG: riboflavin biosynthesis protein RibF [Lachnospiraceae bacterium]|nr:riboflavin biosynthesis protein RibF [Lachnospiraceae bacterium]
MRILSDLADYESAGAASVAIGKFDGIHRGHRRLIEASVREAGALPGGKCVVIVIDSPRTLILTHEERRRVLSDLGVDIVIEQKVDPSFMSTSADEFIRTVLSGKLHAERVVVGRDFRFGFRRAGDSMMLSARGPEMGYEAVIIPPVMIGDEKISTTRIREEIGRGCMEAAEEMLGYRYFLEGEVIKGKQLGRSLGFPTANMAAAGEKLLPPFGVYYSISGWKGRSGIYGMTNIGNNPTVKDRDTKVETHMFDISDDLYGQRLKVELLHHARPEIRFDSVELLAAQLKADREKGMGYFKLDSR